MKFKDGVLMITTHPENEDKIVVPQYYQSKLMKSFHEMDHSGMDRTESRIQQYCYWYGMQAVSGQNATAEMPITKTP